MLAPAHMLLIIFLGRKDLIMQPKSICNQTVAIPSPPCLSTYLSVYLPTCLSTCLFTYLPVYLPAWLPTHTLLVQSLRVFSTRLVLLL